jgi:hypothetical protein
MSIDFDATATGTSLLGYGVTLWAGSYCVDRAFAARREQVDPGARLLMVPTTGGWA